MLTQERLKSLLHYDPISGWFTNLTARNYRCIVGERAGTIKVNGRYRMISIDGTSYYEHRLAWLYMRGYMPDNVDHVNGNGCFNVWDNLREATATYNLGNGDFSPGASGLRGAYWRHSTRNWFASIQFGGKGIYLGSFDTAEEAHAAYIEAAELYFGEFAFHNRPKPQPQISWRRI